MRLHPVIGRASYYVFAGGLAIMFLIPLVWAVVASVSPHGATAQQDGYGFGNYQMLVDYDAGLLRYLWNSSVVSALTVVFTLVLSTLGGYAFARFRFWGRDTLFLLVIAILMVPYATLLVPLWVLLGEIGLRNNLLGLAIVMTLYQLPFAMFMMRVSFEAVPRELEESALVDGCGTFAVLRWILLRAVWPGIITVGLFAFLNAWNDYIAPLFLINDSAKYPLPLAIANLRGGTSGVNLGVTEAGVVVMAIPCLILFLLLQRRHRLSRAGNSVAQPPALSGRRGERLGPRAGRTLSRGPTTTTQSRR
jgi:multiple sugar transport system permease protein